MKGGIDAEEIKQINKQLYFRAVRTLGGGSNSEEAVACVGRQKLAKTCSANSQDAARSLDESISATLY